MLAPHLTLFLAVMGFFTGFVKTGLPAMGAFVSVLLFLVFGQDALGITLLFFLAGDIFAVYYNWQHADFKILKALLPSIGLGMIIAIFILKNITESHLNLLVGSIILLIILLEPFRESVTKWTQKHHQWSSKTAGTLAGITTTVGNAAGPIMAVYLLLMKLNKFSFVGTTAIFFCIVNLVKVPIYLSLDIFKTYYLSSVLLCIPLVVLGSLTGKKFLQWVPQKTFNTIVIIFTGLSGLWLIGKTLI